jgi:hypothetical protein
MLNASSNGARRLGLILVLEKKHVEGWYPSFAAIV